MAAMPGTAATNARGGTVRYFSAAIAPPSVAAGTTGSYTMTFKNCDGTGTCGSSTTSQNQQIGAMTIAVPAGFTITATPFVLTPPTGKNWTASLSSGTITLLASAGNQRLEVGESLTLTFEATAPCSGGSGTWETHAYQDTTLPSSTEYELVTAQPQVTVTGNCATVCPQGQGYWKTHLALWPLAVQNNGMTLGTVHYTYAQLMAIMGMNPAGGDKLLTLAHQLITARLNIANNVTNTVATALADADAIIGSLVVGVDQFGTPAPANWETVKNRLEAFNIATCP
jgi:hypothetical protein